MLRSVVQTQSKLMKSVGKTGVRSLASETYTEKQAKKGRPVSPHVTIYKFPVVALSSITNRVTGVILSGGKEDFFICLFFLILYCFCLL